MQNSDICYIANCLNNTYIEEECMICKENLYDKPFYTLPECQHSYHTHCLISWFRNGDSRCPYCGNKGINNKNSTDNTKRFRLSRLNDISSYERQYLSDLHKFAFNKKNINDKNAILLKDKFLSIKVLEDNLKENDKKYKEYKKYIKNTDVTVRYHETKKLLSTYRLKSWRLKKYIKLERYKLLDNSYIVPLIIPLPIDIN